MCVFESVEEIQAEIGRLKNAGGDIGLVPTMGALHRGHAEIIRRAAKENSSVVVSIFVNPTQFNDAEDLKKYPRTLEEDLALLRNISEEILVFNPGVEEMYPNSASSKEYRFSGLDRIMEGQFRPGHFQGVATIVEKLLTSINPDRAYFGEKDYQQLMIVKSLVKQRNLPVEIVPCSIVREDHGLALSSRNSRLSNRLRMEASFIYQVLRTAKAQFGMKSAGKISEWAKKQFKVHPDLELEYFIIADSEKLRPVMRKSKNKKYRAFVAAYAEGVRLIDNIALN